MEDRVMTTCYPVEYFAQRIAGGLVPVVNPLPEDQDAIFWQPSREQIQQYQCARLIVINGASFEKWVHTAALPLSRLCDTARPLASDLIPFESTNHSHGAGGTHAHEGTDGHTWLDPNNAVLQSEQILLSMSASWPEHERAFRDNWNALRDDLMQLDARFRTIFSRQTGVRVVANHPAYNYLAKRYAFTLKNFDVPPDQPLAPEELAKIKSFLAPATGPVIMLIEDAPTEELAAALKAASVTPVPFLPLENLAAEDRKAGLDYLKIMHASLDRLENSLPATPPSQPAPGN
jgi:zinc transport system substrate-binding protein